MTKSFCEICEIKGIHVFTLLMGLSVILINTVIAPLLKDQHTHYMIEPTNPFKMKIKEQIKTNFSICPQFSGRLGNKMFIFASSYGVALEKNMKLEIDSDNELWRVFKLSVDVRKKGLNCKSGKVKILTERKSAAFDHRLVDFNATSSVSLRTFLQSFLYFENHTTEVRNQFRFKEAIQLRADSIIKQLLSKHCIVDRKSTTLIGIHVRRGDIVRLSIKNKKAGYKLASKEYIHKAVSWYKERFNNLLFIVASNGVNWTKLNMPRNIKVEYLENNTDAVDLAALASTDHFITTWGTFSWWAGWLTGGTVTYYKWPAIEGGRYRKAFSKDYMDHYYSDWIGF